MDAAEREAAFTAALKLAILGWMPALGIPSSSTATARAPASGCPLSEIALITVLNVKTLGGTPSSFMRCSTRHTPASTSAASTTARTHPAALTAR